MPKQVSYEQYKKLKDWYTDQLKSKDKLIEKLKKENEVIVKTALSQAHHAKDWEEIAHRVEKRIRKR